ncbi:HipA domain-containing protein [Adlercreutzia sp. R7]|uniref:HipA domain-containing protein n=1 Tax=Adlercreutzia wanghongyangiae TaxID=3111451 RepID=A0ABU6IIG7_9ACTN|nr:HipA domain-containing protein [Adlercreutzia sp. R7]
MELIVYRDFPEAPLPMGALARTEGKITFRYHENYLASPAAAPLSLSLPLRAEPYAEEELTPYFRGLLPEGAALENLCRSLGIPQDDYFAMLAVCGLDCLGDVIIDPAAYAETRSYETVSLDHIKEMAGKPGKIDESLETARLSLAGTQSKCGLFHDPSAPITEGWYQPVGGAPSNYIVKFAREDLIDLMQVEHLSMTCAAACGLDVARTALISPLKPIICVERYDRRVTSNDTIDGLAAPLRQHQEDLTQAFGLLPHAKYRELKPSSVQVIADFLRRRSAEPARDLRAFASLILFNYLIGNCDNHLKNMSILYAPDWRSFTLAPAYDLVSTTYFARFSREMGMAIGEHSDIDGVTTADFAVLAEQLGVGMKVLRGIATTFTEQAIPALRNEGARLGDEGYGTAPYIADDIEEDILPRLELLTTL